MNSTEVTAHALDPLHELIAAFRTYEQDDNRKHYQWIVIVDFVTNYRDKLNEKLQLNISEQIEQNERMYFRYVNKPNTSVSATPFTLDTAAAALRFTLYNIDFTSFTLYNIAFTSFTLYNIAFTSFTLYNIAFTSFTLYNIAFTSFTLYNIAFTSLY
jgi:uncharacterized protein with PQ loop repeat